MILKEITESELSANGVSALPTRPNAAREFGGRGYTPAQLKAAFDRLPRLVAARYNELVRQIEEGELSESLSVEVEGGCKSLQEAVTELFSDMGDVKTGLMGCATKAALSKSAVEYRDGTITVTVGGEEPYASGSVSLPIPAMQNDIDLLYKIVSQTIVTDTEAEDTYTARVTAGGLNIVDGAPTAVHKIRGATVASKNMLQLADGTTTLNGVTAVINSTTGEVTLSGESTLDEGDVEITVATCVLPTGTYTFYMEDHDWTWYVKNSSTGDTIATWMTNTDEYSGVVFTLEEETTVSVVAAVSVMSTLGITIMPAIAAGDVTADFPAPEPFYAGVRQAYFKGIVSTGRNLIASIRSNGFTSAGVTYTFDVANGTITMNGTMSGNSSGTVTNNFYLPKGTYTLYVPNRIRYTEWQIRNTSNKAIEKLSWTADASVKSKTFTITESGNYSIYLFISSSASTIDNYVETPMVLPGAVTSDFPAFETYKSDTSFVSDELLILGKWDYIDVDRQKVVYKTETLSKTTPFTDEELAQYSDYVLSADRKEIAYPVEEAKEIDMTIPTCYTAYRGGLEMIEQEGKGNGTENTVTQNYFVIAGGDEA